MKLTLTNNIFDVENEHGTKQFERRIFTILKRNGIFGEVVCVDAGIISKFEVFATIEVNKKSIRLRDFERNDIPKKPTTAKEKRNLFFEILNNQIEYLKTVLN